MSWPTRQTPLDSKIWIPSRRAHRTCVHPYASRPQDLKRALRCALDHVLTSAKAPQRTVINHAAPRIDDLWESAATPSLVNESTSCHSSLLSLPFLRVCHLEDGSYQHVQLPVLEEVSVGHRHGPALSARMNQSTENTTFAAIIAAEITHRHSKPPEKEHLRRFHSSSVPNFYSYFQRNVSRRFEHARMCLNQRAKY